MIQYTKRTKEFGGDFWTVDNTYFYSNPYQAALKVALLETGVITALNAAGKGKAEELVSLAYNHLKTLSRESLGGFSDPTLERMNRNAKNWNL